MTEMFYLEDEEEEEVGVGEPAELFKEVQRQEGEKVVFGRFDGIFLRNKKNKRCFKISSFLYQMWKKVLKVKVMNKKCHVSHNASLNHPKQT